MDGYNDNRGALIHDYEDYLLARIDALNRRIHELEATVESLKAANIQLEAKVRLRDNQLTELGEQLKCGREQLMSLCDLCHHPADKHQPYESGLCYMEPDDEVMYRVYYAQDGIEQPPFETSDDHIPFPNTDPPAYYPNWPTGVDYIRTEIFVAPIQFASPSVLHEATIGRPYASALQAAEGHPPYHWAEIYPYNNHGLGISPGGIVYGTPIVSGTIQLAARVYDSTNDWIQTSITIPVAARVVPPQSANWDGISYTFTYSNQSLLINYVFTARSDDPIVNSPSPGDGWVLVSRVATLDRPRLQTLLTPPSVDPSAVPTWDRTSLAIPPIDVLIASLANTPPRKNNKSADPPLVSDEVTEFEPFTEPEPPQGDEGETLAAARAQFMAEITRMNATRQLILNAQAPITEYMSNPTPVLEESALVNMSAEERALAQQRVLNTRTSANAINNNLENVRSALQQYGRNYPDGVFSENFKTQFSGPPGEGTGTYDIWYTVLKGNLERLRAAETAMTRIAGTIESQAISSEYVFQTAVADINLMNQIVDASVGLGAYAPFVLAAFSDSYNNSNYAGAIQQVNVSVQLVWQQYDLLQSLLSMSWASVAASAAETIITNSWTAVTNVYNSIKSFFGF